MVKGLTRLLVIWYNKFIGSRVHYALKKALHKERTRNVSCKSASSQGVMGTGR